MKKSPLWVPCAALVLSLLLITGCGDDDSPGGGAGGGGSEFLVYNLDNSGSTTVTQAFPDSCMAGVFITDASPAPGTAIIAMWNLGTTLDLFEIDFPGNSAGTGLTPVGALWSAGAVDLAGYTSGTVNITAYGAVGESIAGNFDFVVTDLGSATHTLTGSFKVTRLPDTVTASATCA